MNEALQLGVIYDGNGEVLSIRTPYRCQPVALKCVKLAAKTRKRNERRSHFNPLPHSLANNGNLSFLKAASRTRRIRSHKFQYCCGTLTVNARISFPTVIDHLAFYPFSVTLCYVFCQT